jgi:pSer/pThr/pTyr-binding forkhead associated (FHA) protein
VSSLAGPTHLALDPPSDDSKPIGQLLIAARRREGSLSFGRASMRRGVLLGRDDRCEANAVLDEGHLSRVHALLIMIGDALFAIDTGSTNGLWRSEERISSAEMLPGQPLTMSQRAHFEWRPIH